MFLLEFSTSFWRIRRWVSHVPPTSQGFFSTSACGTTSGLRPSLGPMPLVPAPPVDPPPLGPAPPRASALPLPDCVVPPPPAADASVEKPAARRTPKTPSPRVEMRIGRCSYDNPELGASASTLQV